MRPRFLEMVHDVEKRIVGVSGAAAVTDEQDSSFYLVLGRLVQKFQLFF